MSAEDIFDRIEEVQAAYIADPRKQRNVIHLTTREIQSYINSYAPGTALDALTQVGVVRILNSDKGGTMTAPPTKYVDPANDLARYRMAEANALKAGNPPPIPTAYEQQLIDADRAGQPLPAREEVADAGRPPMAVDPLGPSPFQAAIDAAVNQAKVEILAAVSAAFSAARQADGLAKPPAGTPASGVAMMGWQNRTFSDLIEAALEKRRTLLDHGLPIESLELIPFPVNEREAEAINHYLAVPRGKH